MKFLLAIVFLVSGSEFSQCAAPPHLAASQPRPVADDKLGAWIEHLDDDDFEIRNRAAKELGKIAQPNLERLLQVYFSEKRLEVRQQLEFVLRSGDLTIDEKLLAKWIGSFLRKAMDSKKAQNSLSTGQLEKITQKLSPASRLALTDAMKNAKGITPKNFHEHKKQVETLFERVFGTRCVAYPIEGNALIVQFKKEGTPNYIFAKGQDLVELFMEDVTKNYHASGSKHVEIPIMIPQVFLDMKVRASSAKQPVKVANLGKIPTKVFVVATLPLEDGKKGKIALQYLEADINKIQANGALDTEVGAPEEIAAKWIREEAKLAK